ncbi:MAG: oligosaccharide flippase family protein, partial [Endomicrobiales bacterium]
MEGLKRRAANCIKWQVGVSLFQKILTFGTTIILARKLGPSVYGLFAFSLVIVSSFELFKSMGIDAALVRRRDDFDAAANTAFFIIPLLGLLLYAMLHLSAPSIGKLLHNAQIVPVVKVLGLIFVLGCFTKVPTISMERDLSFKKISFAEALSALVFSASALTLVMLDFGIWTLVYAYLLRMSAYLLLVWFFSGWRPRFTFDPKLALEM